MRLSNWPKLPPASHDSSADSTKKTVKIIHARQPPPVSTAVPKKPTAIAMQAAQSMISAPIRAPQLASEPRPSRGKPKTLAGIGFARRGRVRCFVRHVAEVTWRSLGTMSVWSAARGFRPAPCYMCETFVQLDRNRISIRLPKATEGGTHSAFVQLCLLSVECAQSLKAEQVVHLRAFKRVTTERAQGTTYLTGGQMFQGADDLLAYVKDEGVEFIDIRFCDLPGIMQHFTVPAGSFGHEFFEDGVNFDGSSIRGFQKIHESDMALLPDPTTAYLDPFRAAKTLCVNFFVHDPLTKEPYSRDPRNIARKAESYLASTGIGDTAYFAPEAEFYMFDDVRFETKQQTGYYAIDSVAGAWNTGRIEDGGNRGYKVRYKGGYFPVPPVDHFADLRDTIVKNLEASGLSVERAHHEVGTAGQAEINYASTRC